MSLRHLPNIITVCRIALVYPIIASMMSDRFGTALILFFIAGLSDALDGFLAKYFNWQSRLGGYLDPIADKLLLVSSYVVLSWMGFLPVWLTVAVVARDILIFGGAVAYYLLLKPFEGQPLLISKLNTLLQLMLVFLVLTDQAVMPMPGWMESAGILAVFGTTLLSGGLYIYLWGTNYYREIHRSTGNPAT